MSTKTPPATITPSISLVPVDSIEPQYVVEGTSTKLRNNVHAKYVKICYGESKSIGIDQSVVFGLKTPAPLVFVLRLSIAYSTLNFVTNHAPRIACKSTTTQAFDATKHVRAEATRLRENEFGSALRRGKGKD